MARWGGDEFVLVGIGPEPDRADYGRRLAAALDLRGLEIQWSGCVSVGPACRSDTDVPSVIDGADTDMYASRTSCSP